MKELIYQFINQNKLAVVSSVNSDGKPESALVGIALSTNLEIVFDTVKSSRKYHNILKNPHVSIVIGWDNETTVQYSTKATPVYWARVIMLIISGRSTMPHGRTGKNAPKPGPDWFTSK